MSGRKRKAVSYKEDSSEFDQDDSSADFNESEDESVGMDSESEENKQNQKKSTPKKSQTEKSPKQKSPAKLSSKMTNNKPSEASNKNNSISTASKIQAITTVSALPVMDGPPVTTDSAAKKLVLQYTKQQNRPYSLTQIHDNLHKRVPKATLERVLSLMSGPGGELIAKEYGKSKIYYMNQLSLSSSLSSSTTSATQSTETLESLQEENSILREELDEVKLKVKNTQEEFALLAQEPADEDMER